MEYKSEESVFNMALAYLKRIDKLLYMCQQASMEQNIPMWISSLRGVYRELSVKLSQDEENEIFGEGGKLINVLDKNIDYSEYANFRNINYLYNNPMTLRQNKSIILYLLDKLEIKIRRKLQQKGMLLPSKDDPRFAVLKR
jgi:hypothetical protein